MTTDVNFAILHKFVFNTRCDKWQISPGKDYVSDMFLMKILLESIIIIIKPNWRLCVRFNRLSIISELPHVIIFIIQVLNVRILQKTSYIHTAPLIKELHNSNDKIILEPHVTFGKEGNRKNVCFHTRLKAWSAIERKRGLGKYWQTFELWGVEVVRVCKLC